MHLQCSQGVSRLSAQLFVVVRSVFVAGARGRLLRGLTRRWGVTRLRCTFGVLVRDVNDILVPLERVVLNFVGHERGVPDDVAPQTPTHCAGELQVSVRRTSVVVG